MRKDDVTSGRIVVAALAVLAAALFALRFDFSLETLQFAGLCVILALICVEDLSKRTIPNTCILAAAGLRIACMAALVSAGKLAAGDFAYYLLSGLGIGGALLLFSLVFEHVTGRSGMGGGDVKLYAVAALYVGAEKAFGVMLLSCLAVLVAGVVAPKADSTESALKRTLPFGPAIAGALAVFLFVG